RIGRAQRRRGRDDFLRRARQRGQPRRDGDGGRKAFADRGKVARAAAAEREARERARQIGRGGKLLAQVGAPGGVGDERRNGVVAARDRGRIRQRRREPLGEQARARRRHGAVDGGQQRAAALARKRAHQFQIGARRRVDQQGRAGGLAARRRERRLTPDLRALDVGDAGGRRGQLEARERAEGLGALHG